jgi:hypothetical protein
MYADDLKIYHSVRSLEDSLLIQSDLERFCKYCKDNMLTLNLKKCSAITFSRNKSIVEFQYKLDNATVNSVTKIKDLGVIFDHKMLFDEHITYATNKASRMLGFIIRTTFDFRNIGAIRTLYMAYVNSVLSYGSIIWNPCYHVYIDRLERVQNRLIRHVHIKHFSRFTDDRTFAKDSLKLFALKDRRQLADVKFIYRVCNGMIDSSPLLDMIKFKVPSRIVRSNNLFCTELANTNYYYNSPLNRCTRSFDFMSTVVPLDIFCMSLSTLVKLIKDYYLFHYLD